MSELAREGGITDWISASMKRVLLQHRARRGRGYQMRMITRDMLTTMNKRQPVRHSRIDVWQWLVVRVMKGITARS